jgi:hypothetical protein
VAVDGTDNVVIAGRFSGTVNFGGAALTSAGGNDIFIARYDAAGVHQWSQRFGSTGADLGRGVAADPAGDVVLAGSFTGTVNFGGGALSSAGGTDVFLARYDAAGAHRWSQRFGSTGGDEAHSVDVNAEGTQVVAGSYVLTASFGGTTFTSAGLSDAFVALYGNDPIEPAIGSIVDVANDEGRRVEISFSRSGYEAAGVHDAVVQYEAFRRIDPLPFAQPVGVPSGPGRERRPLMDGWEFAGAVAATDAPGYQMIVPTLADSTISDGLHESVFFIRAATATPVIFFDSPADSGYSLDNLAPPAPSNLVYAAGALSWDASSAGDFNHFSAYGSALGIFDASAVLLEQTTDTNLDVSASVYDHYYVTATDHAGNEGPAAGATSLTAVGGPGPRYTLGINAYPNPFNPSTTVRYDVPASGPVAVRVYDARGARVATLVEAEREAGSYATRWDGRGENRRGLSSGVYFVTVEFEGRTRTRKVVLVK